MLSRPEKSPPDQRAQMTAPGEATVRLRGPSSGSVGRMAVVLMVGLGGGLALFGILFQRGQTIRCLRFLGPIAARRVAKADHVELLRLQPSAAEGRLVAVERWDITRARGLVHLRRGLVEDANYSWEVRDDGDGRARLAPAAWEWGIAFADSPSAVDDGGATIVVFTGGRAAGGGKGNGGENRSEEPGWITVVGSPGRVRLGRIERGLRVWIDDFTRGPGPVVDRAR